MTAPDQAKRRPAAALANVRERGVVTRSRGARRDLPLRPRWTLALLGSAALPI
ncbi:hypothetical protein [Saccharopolyspora sp. ASAGF58]|uniref:hypothetical protein n=1 Tax=Saccharopolyspora sp. ASAGF58 TaxID=2719023 RepID=UPI0014460EF7|nr:hypothetical protein [Saccharopolyspora sp. ASAGF58]